MALLFTVLCGLALAALGYFSHYFHRGHFIRGTEEVIDTEIRFLEAIAQAGDLEQFVAEDDNSRRLYILFQGDEKAEDIVPGNLSSFADCMLVFDHEVNGRRYAAKRHEFASGERLLIGVDITEISEDYAFMRALSIISILSMVVVIVVSFLLSFLGVSSTNMVAQMARDIMDTGDLSRRIDVKSRWDDLSNMAAILNGMLDRLEILLTGVRRVSDNIAHDLRTPLTRMRNSIEALQKKDPRPEHGKLLEEADHLLSTFSALLRISRIEFEHQRKNFSAVKMDDLVKDVIELYEPLAEEKNIDISTELDAAEYKADRDLLFQAFANLLDNAIKYTPESGKIVLRIMKKKHRKRSSLRFEIEDNGPGVEACDHERIFKRFYRVEQCRSTPGTGLGLSLVAAVVTLHRGRIYAEDANPGLRIVIDF
jgi:signal transduction histidine kinase